MDRDDWQQQRDLEERMQECNYADSEGKGCTANDGEPCLACAAREREEMAYWLGQWRIAPLSETNPKAYAESLRDAGRGHLLRPHERELLDNGGDRK